MASQKLALGRTVRRVLRTHSSNEEQTGARPFEKSGGKMYRPPARYPTSHATRR